MAEASRQYNWRNNGRTVASVCAHLGARECAVLDAIAIELYEQNPHDPINGDESEVFPGRAAAIRFLCESYESQLPKRRVQSLGRLAALREQLSQFWVREASWRRTTRKSLVKWDTSPPAPPWRRPARS